MAKQPGEASETTVTVQSSTDGEYVKSSWELLISPSDGGGQRRVPLQCQQLRLQNGFTPEGPTLAFRWHEGNLFYSNETASLPVKKNQDFAQLGQLQPGDVLSWGGHQVKVWDRLSSRRATLECYSDPFSARVWPLDDGPTLIGRSGQRQNQLVLEHRTISRSHATIFWSSPGPVILCESPRALILVDGQKVDFAERIALADGALVQLGELSFRFRLIPELPEEVVVEKLFISSFGGFTARVGRRVVTEKSWRTQATRWLLARLALEWGRPLPIEVILEEFWPDHPPEKSKNNLNFCISTLRQVLRGEGGLNYLVRSNSALQLHPELLGEHDLCQFQNHLESAKARPTEALSFYEAALRVYRADYLSGCYMDWVEKPREQLRQRALQAGLFCLRQREATHQCQAVIDNARLVLAFENSCQVSYAALIRAYHQLGRLKEAREAYWDCRQVTARELGAEPDGEVQQAFEALR